MNKYIVSSLAIASVFVSYPLAARGATLTHTVEVPFASTDWRNTLVLPKYNPANHSNQPLTGISITAQAQAQGTYSLTNLRQIGPIGYGTPSNMVGASLFVTGPSSSVTLNPFPMSSIGSGVIPAGGTITRNILGSDTELDTVAPADFNLYTGTGNVNFQADAFSVIDVTKLGTPFREIANIEAYLKLTLTYTYNDPPIPPTAIDEPNLGAFSILACVLGGFFLSARKNEP
jgi:hypothetical protein